MKILMVNSVCGIRSTGRICTDLASALEEQGHEVKIAYGRENVPDRFQKYAVRIGTDWDVKLHGLKARLFDASGFGSKRATEKFIEWVKQYDPDIIHLHNIHGYYINIEVLFQYLKTCGKKIIWTLHDCWAFTGHCVYFDYAGCEKWKEQCDCCPEKREYPACIGISKSKQNFQNKKSLFTGVPNLTIITPSVWLKKYVECSFVKKYPVQVINNGIDTCMFKPTKSNIKQRFHLENKIIVLGVASIWDRRKGLSYLIELAKKLDDSYKVVVIGLNEKQVKQLPDYMLGIHHTSNVQELVEWYSAADVYVNPTLEDNYPTTNLEAISCGTPCITFQTGGSPESAMLFGKVVDEIDGESIHSMLPKSKPQLDIDTISIRRMIDAFISVYEVG